MKPSIGRIVHFVTLDREHRPAIITKVLTDELVNLHVIPDPLDSPGTGGGVLLVNHSQPPEGMSPAAYTWHWPERVE